MITTRTLGYHKTVDYIQKLDVLRNDAVIKARKVECLKQYHLKGFPMKTYVKKLKDNTITVREWERLNWHIDRIANQPVETFYAK